MSASPILDPPAMPTMVSRLPKFGSRPKPQTHPAAAAVNATSSTRLTNGFYHHPGPTGGNGAPPSSPKQNGFIRTPSSFSGRWKEDGGKGGNIVQTRSGVHQYYSQRPQGSPLMSQRDAKKAAFNGKGRVYGQPQSASSPAVSPQSSPRTLPLSRSGTKLSSPGPPSGARQSPVIPRSKPRSSSLRQPQTVHHPRPGSGPGSRSGSPLNKKPPAGRSYSSDSLGSAPSSQLSENDRLRSRSLTQVRRQPSPTLSSSSSLPRSRVAERGSPPEGGARGGRGVKPGSGRYGATAILPPTALKKPLLPSLSPTSKPSGISYKLSRPSLMKQPRPLRVAPTEACGGVRRMNSIETPSTTENSPETSPESDGTSPELVSQGEVSIVGETLEDMSLSSTSSLDRNDTSQEYMDDFDNFGSGGVGLLLLSAKNDEDDSGLDQSCTRFDDDRVSVNGVTKATGLCFLDDGADWTSPTLTGERVEHRLSRRRRSSQPEYHDQGGSSLDLSPSDSCGSAGTYLWDEEGLEPLGGPTTNTTATTSIHTNNDTTHHIGSFDSDLNSIDLLNHLDSCDLADDDLMLDVDFPEDASLHSEVEGLPHMAQWRKRQLCWGTQDIHDNDDFHSLTSDPGKKRGEDADLILELRSVGLTPAAPAAPGLGVDVEELAEDCSAVRTQLEYLQKLLLQEEDADDDTLTTDTLSPDTNDSSHSSASQVEALLQEVQQLREELRSRDRTIAQLTVQLTVPTVATRCCCQETAGRTDQCTQTSARERESVASQTPWKEHKSQVLHSSHQESLTQQAPPPAEGLLHRLAREDAGKRPRSLLPSKLRLFSSHTPGPASSSPPSPQRTSRQLDSQLKAPSSASFMSRLPKPKSQ